MPPFKPCQVCGFTAMLGLAYGGPTLCAGCRREIAPAKRPDPAPVSPQSGNTVVGNEGER